MQKKIFKTLKFYIPLIVIIILLIIILSFINLPLNKTSSEEYDSLAKCLTEKQIKMYGAEWCGYCKNQKSLFEEDFKDIYYMDCDENPEICSEKQITEYPTWIINNQKYPGVQSLEKLAELTDC